MKNREDMKRLTMPMIKGTGKLDLVDVVGGMKYKFYWVPLLQ